MIFLWLIIKNQKNTLKKQYIKKVKKLFKLNLFGINSDII